MKPQLNYAAAIIVLTGWFVSSPRVNADPAQLTATITSFDNFTSDALYPSWTTAAVTSTPSNYIVAATGYGSNYKYIGNAGINGTGCTNLELDITLSASSAAAEGQLGPIVTLIDAHTNTYTYAWYGQTLGRHVLNLAVEKPTSSSNPAGPVGPLDLGQLLHMHLAVDTGGFGASGTYTSAWNNLRLTGPQTVANLAVTNVSISTFNEFVSDALYASWAPTASPAPTILSNATSYVITATGYGSNYKWIGWPLLDGTGCTNIQLDCYISGPAAADGHIGPIVDLIDGDGTRFSYRWYGQRLGHHVLNMPIASPTVVVAAGTTAGLDLTNLLHMHMQVDPGGFGTSGAYTIAWNELRLTGGTSDPCAQNLSVFSDFSLDSRSGAWLTATLVTNTQGYQVTASGYGSGHKRFPFPVDATRNEDLQLTLNLGGDEGISGYVTPSVMLTDSHGTSLTYYWWTLPVGEQVLVQPLGAGIPVLPSQPPFDFARIASYDLQVDPSGFPGSYTLAWEQLDLTGCTPRITSQAYNRDTHDFTLTWQSASGRTYSILTATNLSDGFTTNTMGVPSGGAATTTTVTLPDSPAGFLRVQRE